MQRFMNALKAQAGALDHGIGQPRFATVTSVDPQRYAARVALQPEGVISGWLPILTGWVGAGWGMACPPSPGDQVLVLAQEGDSEHGIIVGRAWSEQSPAVTAPVGELWFVHATGSSIRLCNDGVVHVQGDLRVSGDIFDRHGSLDRLRQHYDAHVHSDPQGGTVSPADPQD